MFGCRRVFSRRQALFSGNLGRPRPDEYLISEKSFLRRDEFSCRLCIVYRQIFLVP